MAKFLKFLALISIKFYQWMISPLLGNRCRFYPSCSSYTYSCFQKFSLLKASRYALIRICKCHPLHEGGFDPVP